MIRVLHVLNWFRPGGVETQILRVLEGYDRSLFTMDACTIGEHPGELADAARALGAEVIQCPKSVNLFKFSGDLSRMLSIRRYDVVHSHFETWGGAILRAAHSVGVPVRIAQFHSMTPWPEEDNDPIRVRAGRVLVSAWGRYWLKRYATHFLAVSEAVYRERVVSLGRCADAGGLWTGGVDTSLFSPEPRAEQPCARPPTVIWVGALRTIKRVDLLLRIFSGLVREMPEARLMVVGSGTKEGELRHQADELGLTESVRFLGVRRDIVDLLRSADIFVSCSEVEGLPTALLEAQAVGLPVVARDIAPHREVLCPELHPFLFEEYHLDRPVAALKDLLQDSSRRRALGETARQFVVDRYDASECLKALQARYVAWIAGRRSSPCGKT